MNKSTTSVIGRLAADAKFVPGTADVGTEGQPGYNRGRSPRCEFTIVFNPHWKKSAPEGQRHINYPCTYWGKRAENIHPHLRQGKTVCVDGMMLPYVQRGNLVVTDENGAVTDTRKVNGWSLRVDEIYLGADSLKNRQADGVAGVIADPKMMDFLTAVAEKVGVNPADFLNAKTEETAEAEQNATEETADEEGETPFGGE